MIGVDTNVILRIILDDDAEQSKRAIALLAAAREREDTILISPVVLVELTWTLAGKLGKSRSQIATHLSDLLATAMFTTGVDSAFRAALEGFQAGKVGFADCLIAAMNREAGAETTYTFDTDAAGSPGFSPVP